MNEAETRAELIDPKLRACGWGVVDDSKILREYNITAGKIQAGGGRGKKEIADYVLVYKGIKLAVVEAKSYELEVGEGVMQAKKYAEKLQVETTYSTNGKSIYQICMKSGEEGLVTEYPSPEQLWNKTFSVQNNWREQFANVPFEDKSGSWQLRYYQEIAVQRTVEAIAQGKDRILLTLATGTGKTAIAFQIAWKLFQTRWTVRRSKDPNEPSRRPRILFLADRNILADQAYNSFSAFPEDALVRIKPNAIKKSGKVPTNGSVFFTIFQTFMSGSTGSPTAASAVDSSLAMESMESMGSTSSPTDSIDPTAASAVFSESTAPVGAECSVGSVGELVEPSEPNDLGEPTDHSVATVGELVEPTDHSVATSGSLDSVSELVELQIRHSAYGYMYILQCADGSFYTGSTLDLSQRLAQHKEGVGANFTSKHLPVKLVYYETFDRIEDAFSREKQIQKWSRAKKIALIQGDKEKLKQLSKSYSSPPLTPALKPMPRPSVPELVEGVEGVEGVEKVEKTEGFYFGQYPPDYFDFIIIDECHRGGANDESNWRGILNYFSPAVQLGLTATPKRKDNIDTYRYFGEPVYIYSLKEGINDGFLTPFKVKRVQTTLDDYRYTSDDTVEEGEVEYGKLYEEKDFNKNIEIVEREAKRVNIYLNDVNQKEKAIIFCANQPHAALIRDLVNQNTKYKDPFYCVRVTANDGEEGERMLREFQDNEKTIPTILTTSQKLSTGVDARNIRNIVLLRPVQSMIEFKQIVGRGTRLFDGKEFFTIYDFVNAYKHFSDPEWDGEPLDPEPNPPIPPNVPPIDPSGTGTGGTGGRGQQERKKKIKIKLRNGKEREINFMMDTSFWSADGTPLSAEEFLNNLFGELPKLFKDENELRELWSKPSTRKVLLENLDAAGFPKGDLLILQNLVDMEKSDLYDVLEYVFNGDYIAMTREARAKAAEATIFSLINDKQKEFIAFVLSKYIETGVDELDQEKLPTLLTNKYQSLEDAKEILGDVSNISRLFIEFQEHLYKQSAA